MFWGAWAIIREDLWFFSGELLSGWPGGTINFDFCGRMQSEANKNARQARGIIPKRACYIVAPFHTAPEDNDCELAQSLVFLATKRLKLCCDKLSTQSFNSQFSPNRKCIRNPPRSSPGARLQRRTSLRGSWMRQLAYVTNGHFIPIL